ncbi:hypothetical protein F2Q70_00025783 [Brassica cretica]|uniref:Uncharacterized protein n=1 Tax=Brassica cretica TaxID=69181 RepID=A0A8S9LD48_BRACR|nr:hypothetical protein F2Q70_00025783 [Brassica cretica]
MQGSQAGHNIFRPDSWVDRTPFSTHQIPSELFRERIPTKHREHCFSASSKGAVKEAGEHTFQLLFTSGFQLPGPRSQVLEYHMEFLETFGCIWSSKEQAPTTLLALFQATNPDIPLKEIKAFYPLQTPGETQDLCLSKSPRLHPSTSCKKRKFPVMESRIRQSTRKENSRQSDGSFSDIQETLRVAHPRGSREQPEEVTKRQKKNIYRSSCARALVPRSFEVLKDKSTGPPREVASRPQQRPPFLQGPVTGPEPGSTHQDHGLPSGKTTILQVLTRTRPKKKSEKGKQRTVHYRHAEMERLRTLVSIHPHEEVSTPTPTTKLRLRPLLLCLTPGSDNNNGYET